MWTYTAYILCKYLERHPEKREGLKFSDFADFIFNELWRKGRVVFHDGAEDLFSDILYLVKLGILEVERKEKFENSVIKIRNIEQLNEVAKVVENSFAVIKFDLLDEYLKRINMVISGA